MKSILIAVAAAAALGAAGIAGAQEDLAKSDGCLNCHSLDTKKVGPAFKDVAKKYKGQKDADDKLKNEIASAKGHPKTKASPEDIDKLVHWVLSM